MLVVTKNIIKCVGGKQSSSVVRFDLRVCGFFGEFYTLAKRFGPILRGFGRAFKKGRVLFLETVRISVY